MRSTNNCTRALNWVKIDEKNAVGLGQKPRCLRRGLGVQEDGHGQKQQNCGHYQERSACAPVHERPSEIHYYFRALSLTTWIQNPGSLIDEICRGTRYRTLLHCRMKYYSTHPAFFIVNTNSLASSLDSSRYADFNAGLAPVGNFP